MNIPTHCEYSTCTDPWQTVVNKRHVCTAHAYTLRGIMAIDESRRLCEEMLEAIKARKIEPDLPQDLLGRIKTQASRLTELVLEAPIRLIRDEEGIPV